MEISLRITTLRGARNPHVPTCTFWFLRAVRLALHQAISISLSTSWINSALFSNTNIDKGN
jgi:hypothetical protein